MTQGRAMDAGPREWVLAEIDRLVEGCRTATPGPWGWTEESPHGDGGPDLYSCSVTDPVPHSPRSTPIPRRVVAGWGHDWWGTEVEPPDQAHIAAHDPSRMAALWEWLRGEVEKHDDGGCTACESSSDCWFTPPLAAALGYREAGGDDEEMPAGHCGEARPHGGHDWEPGAGRVQHCPGNEYAPETGGGERGTPAGHGDSEGGQKSNGPASVADKPAEYLGFMSLPADAQAALGGGRAPRAEAASPHAEGGADERCSHPLGGYCGVRRDMHDAFGYNHAFAPPRPPEAPEQPERRMKISGPDTYGYYRTSCPCTWAGGPWNRRGAAVREWERHGCTTEFAAPEPERGQG